MKILLSIVFIIFNSFNLASAQSEVECEEIIFAGWNLIDSSTVDHKTCWLQETTIDSTGFVISSTKDDNVTGLTLMTNENAFYLPEKVSTVFPNLLMYGASNSSIKEISKNNFEGLDKLTHLMLENNQIEKVPSGVFEGLKSLQILSLRELILKT